MVGESARELVVRVGEAACLPDLAAHLERSGCRTSARDAATLAVTLPDTAHPRAAELELDLYLQVWRARTSADAQRVEQD